MTTGSGGWACVFIHDMRGQKPDLRFKNAAVEGEDSCSFFTISTYCPALSSAQQKSLRPQPGSQMATALAYLRQHQGEVSPITFQLGGNDQIAPGVRGRDTRAMEARIDRILFRLIQLARRADLIVMDYPHSSVPSPVSYRREASKYGGLIVDVRARFAKHQDYVDSTDHPTDAGQRLVARVLWQTYKSWIRGK